MIRLRLSHSAKLLTLAVALCMCVSASAESKKKLVPLPSEVPSPADNPTTPEKVELGKKLFFDPRLSGDNTISCAGCHAPDKAYGDGLPLGIGVAGKKLARNSQTCLNVGLFDSLFWDGRAASLEEQALGPIQSKEEMGQDLAELETELQAIPAYVREFESVFQTPPGRQQIAQALAAYQRTLITGPAPFDRYLQGEKDALSADAIQGLELFRGDAGCIECHHGPLLSDGKFYRLNVNSADIGRAKVTGDSADRYRFRTPSLRNVAETGPYMHDGSRKTLDDVVMFYYRGIPDNGPEGLAPDAYALEGQSFSEIPLLVAFLKSLTGAPPAFVPPLLPALLMSEPDTAISPAVTDENGFRVHLVKSPLQSKPTKIKVLLPDKLEEGNRLPVVYVLPVEGEEFSRYGDGLKEIKKLNLHNKHQAIFVAPTFSRLSWYADHPTDQQVQQEAYFLNVVVPFVEETYPALAERSGRLLLGFSKSGWGAWTLLLRNPQVFGKAAAWDAPMMMQQVGSYGNSPIFGTQENFEKYRVADLLKNAQLGDDTRLILTGYGSFRKHHEEVHALMLEHKVPHVYRDGPQLKHDWHSGWVAEAVELLFAKPE